MDQHQHNEHVHGPASEAEPFISGTYIITDDWSSAQEEAGALDELFIAERIIRQPARAPADDEDDAESGMDIQVIDLKEDGDENDEVFDNNDNPYFSARWREM